MSVAIDGLSGLSAERHFSILASNVVVTTPRTTRTIRFQLAPAVHDMMLRMLLACAFYQSAEKQQRRQLPRGPAVRTTLPVAEDDERKRRQALTR